MFGILGTVVGILFILLGGYLVIFFPSTTVHQTESFSVVGIIMGFIFLVAGVVLVFL
jgi:hypothetical protein